MVGGAPVNTNGLENDVGVPATTSALDTLMVVVAVALAALTTAFPPRQKLAKATPMPPQHSAQMTRGALMKRATAPTMIPPMAPGESATEEGGGDEAPPVPPLVSPVPPLAGATQADTELEPGGEV